MRRPIRLTTTLLLLVACLVTGLLPAAGSWSCPNGTACVYTRGRGFHCLDEPCPMPCCAARRRRGCCGRCAHGLFPGLAAAAGTHRRILGEPDHCRYREGLQIGPVLVSARAVLRVQPHAAAALPAPIEASPVGYLLTLFAPVRGSPPTSSVPSASSPRAPPQPDCA